MTPEVYLLTSNVAVWTQYDSKVKADLSSSALRTAAGVYLVDPIPLDEASLATVIGTDRIAGIIVTNANHGRAAEECAARFSVPIHTCAGAAIPNALAIGEGDHLAPDLNVLTIEGAAPGEIAIHLEREGGTLVIGDALINFGTHGFTLLPAKYCSNQRLMRKSLRKLLALSFERMVFAHGSPITSAARERLIALLDEKR